MRTVSCNDNTCFLENMNSEEDHQNLGQSNMSYTIPVRSSDALVSRQKRGNIKRKTKKQIGSGQCVKRKRLSTIVQRGRGKPAKITTRVQKGRGKQNSKYAAQKGRGKWRKRRVPRIQVGKGKGRRRKS
jgi:hypothetical protein